MLSKHNYKEVQIKTIDNSKSDFLQQKNVNNDRSLE